VALALRCGCVVDAAEWLAMHRTIIIMAVRIVIYSSSLSFKRVNINQRVYLIVQLYIGQPSTNTHRVRTQCLVWGIHVRRAVIMMHTRTAIASTLHHSWNRGNSCSQWCIHSRRWGDASQSSYGSVFCPWKNYRRSLNIRDVVMRFKPK